MGTENSRPRQAGPSPKRPGRDFRKPGAPAPLQRVPGAAERSRGPQRSRRNAGHLKLGSKLNISGSYQVFPYDRSSSSRWHRTKTAQTDSICFSDKPEELFSLCFGLFDEEEEKEKEKMNREKISTV